MTPLAWVLLGLGAAAALIDWMAVAAQRLQVRYLAKPAAIIGILAAAVSLQPQHATVRAWFVAGLAASVAGDLFLLGPPRLFVAALGSFLVGHVAYVVGLILEQRSLGLAGAGLILVAGGGAIVGRPIVAAVRGSPRPGLAGPVIIYVGALSAMVVAAWGSGRVLAIVGASFFYLSDATLAWNRFVAPLRRGRLVTIVSYHLGQAGLALALARHLG